MNYYLSQQACLKWLEELTVYNIRNDELYELDHESFAFLQDCSGPEGCGAVGGEFLEYCVGEGILTEVNPSICRRPAAKSPEPSLRYLELQITDRCNLRCGHCYIGESGQAELPTDDIRKVLAEFEEMQGLRVLITGGEPLLHRDFSVINAMLPDFFIRKVLFSNGMLITPRLLDGLNVDEIQISIDGLEEAHDDLRGKGSFRKAMEAVRLCLSTGLDVSISTMVHAKNLTDFQPMEELFREIGIRDWTVDVPSLAGRLRENPDLGLPPDQAGKYLTYGFGSGIHGGAPGYGCGLHLMSVLPDGRAAKCTFYSDRPAGTINEGLRKCWSRVQPVRLAELTCDCAFLEACRGGCRYRAETLGNALGRDLYRCACYDIMKQE